ncbi:MAG: tetratricopeptide repeat protein, partial [Polyangiales bacterium]
EAWREVGVLHDTRSQNREKAFAAWGQALCAEPSDSQAREAVDRLAGALEDWEGYIRVCEAARAAADEPEDQVAFLRSIANTQDLHLGDPRAAIESLGRILEVDSQATDILDELEGLQVMVGDWLGVSKVYERKLENASDGETRAMLLNRLGALFEEQLADSERAVSYYQQATGEKPDDLHAFEALDRLFASSNDGERLADVLEQRLALEPDPDSRVDVGLRLAELYEAQLARPDAACDAFRAVLEADGQHRGALEGLSRLYERQGQWQDLVDILQRRSDSAQHDAERVELTHQLANVMERELDDELSAISVYGQILRLDEAHEPSVQALLRITKLADYREDAAAVVEPYLRTHERWNDLAALLRLRADAMADPHEKAEQLVALADVHQDGRQDPNGALDALLQAIGERPHDEEIIDRAETVAGDLRRWGDVVDVLFGEASASLDPEHGATLFRRVTRIAESELNDHHKAIDAGERALSLVGDEPSILADLDRLFEKTEQWDRLHEIVTRRLDVDDADRPSLWLRQGRLRAAYLGDLEGALGAYREVLAQDEGRGDAVTAIQGLASKVEVAASALDTLEEYYREQGDLEEVVRLYAKRVAIASTDADRVTLLTEASEIWETELDRPDEALQAMRQAVQLDPRDVVLLETLERLAAQSGRWEDLRGLVDEIASHQDLDRRALYELRLRAATWYRDQLSDARAAEKSLVDAIDLDPEPLEAHAQRVMLLREQDRASDLVGALRAWAKVEPSAEEGVERLREAAEIANEALREPELAADCYQELLSVARDDLSALQALAALRRAQGRWNEVVGLLERSREASGTDEERAVLACDAGGVYQAHLGDSRAAIEAYEAALEFQPNDVAAMDALESLYEAHDRSEALRSLLQRRAEVATDAERPALQVRLAGLYEHSFRDQAAAIAMLREVLRDDPGHEAATVELERLFESREQWDDLAAMLTSRIVEPMEESHRALLSRIATLHADRRNDPSAAIDAYVRIHAEIGPDDNSLRALAALYEQERQWTELAEALEALAERLQEPEAIALLHRAAEVWATRIDDDAQCGRLLQAAYSRFPGDPTTRNVLKAHLEAQGDHQGLAKVLDDELESATTEPERVALLRTISDVYRDRLDDPSSAANYLERAVALDGSDRGALVPLCDLYVAAGRQQDAVPILRQIIESFGKQRSRELANHHHRLGQALESTGDASGALAAYDAAFKIDLTNVAILRDLGKLTHGQGDLDRAQKSFRALLLQKLDDSSGIQKADVYYYLGDIASRQDDTRKAITMLERALAEDASHDQASALLSQLKG